MSIAELKDLIINLTILECKLGSQLSENFMFGIINLTILECKFL